MFKKNRLNPSDLLKLEDILNNHPFLIQNRSASNEGLANKLNLRVEYTENLENEVKAILAPPTDNSYNGVIKINKNNTDKTFSYLHEIMHYLFDVGENNKVTKCFYRKKRDRNREKKELEINYLAAAYAMPCNEIYMALKGYDDSHPKPDEVLFIKNLSEKYNQTEDAVFRRISEVRHIQKIK